MKYFVLLSLFVVLNFNVLADDLKTKANKKQSSTSKGRGGGRGGGRGRGRGKTKN